MDRRHFMLGAALGMSLPAAAQDGERGERMQEFTSGGRPIRAEWFAAAGAASNGQTRPGLLLLHGADGLAYGQNYRVAAGLIAGSGYHVGLIHYLDRTGERRVEYRMIRERYPLWAATIRDGLTWLAGQPGVAPERLGLVGISLGGALALTTAAADPRVKAVVEYSGPVPEDLAEGAKLPPTLVLHGEADRIVPSTNATRLERMLRESGTPHEVQVYPGQGHFLSAPAQFDAAARVSAFLSRHL
jgi:carboxymethylenebutenolidase